MCKNSTPDNGVVFYRTYKYRLTPTKEQSRLFAINAGACRFIYNWGLARWNELYESGQKPTVHGLIVELPTLKTQTKTSWLNDCIAQSLQQSLMNLGEAFFRFFKGKSKKPQFKKKNKSIPSFRLPQRFELREDERKIRLAKFGWVNYRQDRKTQGTPKSITVSYRAGHWYASVHCEIVKPKTIHPFKTAAGVDVGIAKLATIWNGESAQFVSHNSKLDKLYARLSILQSQFSRKVKGSNNRIKAQQKLAKMHKRISDMRKDTLHKLTTDLCKNHALIGIEDLKILNMMKSASGTVERPGRNVAQKRGLNRSIHRQGWGELFRQLDYKSAWFGSMLVLAEAAYTSQTCPACGFVAKENRPTQSLFRCLDCGFEHNADIVGAMNIRNQIVPLS
jgi:putative transposase